MDDNPDAKIILTVPTT